MIIMISLGRRQLFFPTFIAASAGCTNFRSIPLGIGVNIVRGCTSGCPSGSWLAGILTRVFSTRRELVGRTRATGKARYSVLKSTVLLLNATRHFLGTSMLRFQHGKFFSFDLHPSLATGSHSFNHDRETSCITHHRLDTFGYSAFLKHEEGRCIS